MTQNCFDFLASLEFFGIKLGLEQTREVLARLGNPEKGLRFVHVAGSNGKGSVCALLESAFRAAGMKTGFFSSPHLIRVNERFKVNGIDIADETLTGAVEKLRPVVADMAKNGAKVTYFEACVAIAALVFKQANVDIVVWEVGMGGRLDSTNVVTPLLSLITGISMEHSQYLGDTIEKIAGEKAGIIKPGIPVFYSRCTPEDAQKVIRERAAELGAPCSAALPFDISNPANYRRRPDGIPVSQTFSLDDGTEIVTPLIGVHQRYNADLAFTALKYLADTGICRFEDAIRGFERTVWDARMQFFPERNLIMDGAHNPEGLAALSQSLREIYPGEKFHFIFGAFADKDTIGGLTQLAPVAASFRFIHMDTMRESTSISELCSEIQRIMPGIPCDGMPMEQAITEKYPDNIKRVLCGSLHLCGDVLAFLNNEKKES